MFYCYVLLYMCVFIPESNHVMGLRIILGPMITRGHEDPDRECTVLDAHTCVKWGKNMRILDTHYSVHTLYCVRKVPFCTNCPKFSLFFFYANISKTKSKRAAKILNAVHTSFLASPYTSVCKTKNRAFIETHRHYALYW